MLNRRFRLTAALVALVAFSASQAEELWASSACSPTDGMAMEAQGAMTRTASARDPSDHGGMPGVQPGAAAAAVRDFAPMDGSDCPLLSLLGDCFALSLPSVEASAEFAAATPSASVAPPTVSPDLVLALSLLRPPRT